MNCLLQAQNGAVPVQDGTVLCLFDGICASDCTYVTARL